MHALLLNQERKTKIKTVPNLRAVVLEPLTLDNILKHHETNDSILGH